MPRAFRASMARSVMKLRVARKGEVISRQGDTDATLHVVLRGTIQLLIEVRSYTSSGSTVVPS